MSQEAWSQQEWRIIDIMDVYEVSEEKANAIAQVIEHHFESRMIELGWEVMDSLIHSYNLLEEGESNV